MPAKPISRYYNFGLTFRWVQGDAIVAVKRGYVIEGKAVIVFYEPGNGPQVFDRPNENVGYDQHTWVASFPIRPGDWDKPGALSLAADDWARNNKGLADWRDQPQRPPIPIGGRG